PAMALFAGWLGAFAGDLALTVGARGGIYLAGGVVPALGAAFDRTAFLERFLAKGRFRDWLSAVPVRLVLDGNAALRGVARRLAAAT
ncbi:MAG: glucokinase, partial [Thermoanaerobaculia bacterium]